MWFMCLVLPWIVALALVGGGFFFVVVHVGSYAAMSGIT